MKTESLFERDISLYFLFFNFQTLKFEVWRHRLDNNSTRFRAWDRFLHPGLGKNAYLLPHYLWFERHSSSDCRIVHPSNFFLSNFDSVIVQMLYNRNMQSKNFIFLNFIPECTRTISCHLCTIFGDHFLRDLTPNIIV